jgi:hypothetical protein
MWRANYFGRPPIISSPYHDAAAFVKLFTAAVSPDTIGIYGAGYKSTFALNGQFCIGKMVVLSRGKVSSMNKIACS